MPSSVEKNIYLATAVRALAGGAASKLGGGTFLNGAETGAFSYLFNAAAHPPAAAAGAPTSDPSSSAPTAGQIANVAMIGILFIPVAGEVEIGLGLTRLMTYGTDITATGAGDALINLAMPAARSAASDFSAMAANYGAQIESLTTSSGQVLQRFTVGDATVVLRDFGNTAGTTIQVTAKGIVDGIKLRYGL